VWNSLGDVLSVVAGAAVVAVALVDVFYTVLFPGSGHGPVRRPLSRAVRWTFRQTRHLHPAARRRVLPYAGPGEITGTLLSWFALLLVGWAAVYRPALGSAVTAAQGPTDRSWGSALYFSGYDLTTLGLGDLVATTPAYRVLVVAEAGTGFMAFTLAISYFVSVYGTLTGRNTFAMALHDRSGGTGQGSEIVRALWDEGPVAAADHLTTMASGLRGLVQTHSSYPVLRSFHYQREWDALPRILLTCWETATLLRTSIDLRDGARPELTGSAVAEIEAAASRMTTRLASGPAGGGTSEVPVAGEPTAAQLDRWRAHHADLLVELAAAGVPVRPDSGADYLTARTRWDVGLARLAEELLYDWPDGLRPAPGRA
jgi:ion channel